MSRIGQKYEHGLFVTYCTTDVYETKNRLEIISEILRNNLVILEIEKHAQKFLDFWSVSLSLRYNLHHNSYIINNPNHVEL
jgi:trehalose-6-phosphate synthase